MSLNSVNTNMGAMIALQSLEQTQSELAVTQKQISTGYRVADSTDDGAAYAIAQSVRSTVGALTTANQQLGNVQGLLSTTQASLNDISNTMASMRDVLVKLADYNVTGDQRTQYSEQYASFMSQVKSFVEDSDYNGKTLIGNISNNNYTSGAFSRVETVRNESGATYGLATYSGSVMYGSISLSTGSGITAGSAASFLNATSGVFIRMQNSVGSALNTLGSEINFVNNQVSYNNDKIDALNSGLGALVDADLAKESAQLTALQIRQQLGTQSLSLANAAPQTLLSLFK